MWVLLAVASATELCVWVEEPGLPEWWPVANAVAGTHQVQAVDNEDGVLTLMLDIGTVEVRVGESDWRPTHVLGELPDLGAASMLEVSLRSETQGRVMDNTHLQIGLRVAEALNAMALADRDSSIGVAGTDLVHFREGRTDPSALWVAIVRSDGVLRTEGLADRGHPEIEIRGLGEDDTEAELVLRALARSWLAEGRRVRGGHRIVLGGVSHPVRSSRLGPGERLFWIELQTALPKP